jgi:hypothetical protein
MRRMVLVGAIVLGILGPATTALADPIELGACSDPHAIVVRVGQNAKVCVLIPPSD